MKFKSRYWKDAKTLHAEMVRLFDNDDLRRRREIMVRSFYNGQEIQTEGEATRDDSAGVVNHLIGYRGLQRLCDGVFAIYSTTTALIEIKVETGNVEADVTVGERLSKTINEAIYHSGEFEALWSSVSGETGLTGRAPLTFGRHGWCPKMAPNILVPENSPGVAKKIAYAFAPHELSMSVLTDLENSVPAGKKTKFVDVKMVKQIKELLEKQISGEGLNQSSSIMGRETPINPLASTTFDEERTTIKAWFYYEVYFSEEKGHEVVSSTLFTERLNFADKSTADNGEPVVISHVPVAYNSPSEWFHPMIVDSQIGGLKTFSAARGIAELTYNSDIDAEELYNEMIAGEKIRARPKFKMGANANKQLVSEWNVARDSIVPTDVDSVQIYQSGNLLGALTALTQNTAGLTGGSFSNAGRETGELRQQAVERQSQNRSMENNRMSAIYTCLDRLAAEMVRRFLLVKSSPGTEGYDDIAWVRSELEEANIPYVKLAKMKHGRFCYLKIRVARSVGSGDRESELAVAELFVKNIDKFPPEVRPLIMRKWVVLVSRDPDLAERLSILPEIIINAQKLVAENEFDTMMRRAAIGQELNIGSDDIDEDHFPVHLLDTQAFLSESAFRVFTELDARRYAGAVDHMTKHLQRMVSMPASAGAAKVFQQQLQQLVAAAAPIMDQIAEAQSQQGMGMGPKDQMDIAFKTNEQLLKGRKLGLEEAKFEANETQRRQREKRADRQQYSGETAAMKQDRLAHEKLAHEKQTTQQKLELEKEKINVSKNKDKSSKSKSKS